MGMHKYIHIGPFLMIPKVRKDVTRTIRVDKSGKEVKSGFNFDPVTGEEYQVKQVVENVVKEPRTYGDDEHYPEFEKLGLDEETFWEPEGAGCISHAIFISNNNEYNYSPDDEVISLKDLDVENELIKFIAEHDTYIQYYEKVFGPIIVDYGVVPYWS